MERCIATAKQPGKRGCCKSMQSEYNSGHFTLMGSWGLLFRQSRRAMKLKSRTREFGFNIYKHLCIYRNFALLMSYQWLLQQHRSMHPAGWTCGLESCHCAHTMWCSDLCQWSPVIPWGVWTTLYWFEGVCQPPASAWKQDSFLGEVDPGTWLMFTTQTLLSKHLFFQKCLILSCSLGTLPS